MIKTNWGYTLTSASSFTDFLTVEDFNKFTNGKYAGDQRVAQNIPSATRAIQNYCGWHIYPSLECEMVYNIWDLRDAFVGRDLLIQLPARFVSDVKSILIDAVKDGDTWTGNEVTDYDLNESGLIRIFDVGLHDRRSRLRIVYDAGIDAAQMDVLKELTAHRVTHACSSSYGITSEAAGGVSVTYNASWAGNTRSTALPDDNKEILEPYRVKGVF
jgi:hypothetical protein